MEGIMFLSCTKGAVKNLENRLKYSTCKKRKYGIDKSECGGQFGNRIDMPNMYI
jgi:hypothetical protein